ncbi:MAG TPA: hypothetical protein VIL46_12315, partial [Gemmataceae bacterium]
MIPRLLSRRGLTRLGAAGLVVLAAASPAAAQVRHGGDPCPPPYPPCLPAVPGTTVPHPGAPLPYPGAPEAPPAAPSAEQPVPTEAPETAMAPFLGPETGLAVGEPTVAVNAVEGGYIDPAPIRTRFRLRYDFAYGNNRPDRAEFFYAKCGCLATLPPTNPGFDPNAPGPPLPETSVDYQDISPYLEVALTDRFSGFIEAPYRFLNPRVNENVDGFANIRAGARYGLIARPEQYVTVQLLADIPTGDADRGLGNDLVALEPGVLHLGAVSDRLFWMNEFRTWVPLDGTDFAGTVLRYGTGFA